MEILIFMLPIAMPVVFWAIEKIEFFIWDIMDE